MYLRNMVVRALLMEQAGEANAAGGGAPAGSTTEVRAPEGNAPAQAGDTKPVADPKADAKAKAKADAEAKAQAQAKARAESEAAAKARSERARTEADAGKATAAQADREKKEAAARAAAEARTAAAKASEAAAEAKRRQEIAEAAQAEAEGKVLCTSPANFKVNHGGVQHEVKVGSQTLPREIAEHWYAKQHGVKIVGLPVSE